MKTTAAIALSALALLVAAGANLATYHEVKDNHRLALQARKLADDGVQAHKALCQLSDDFRLRIKNDLKSLRTTEDYVRDHPHGALGLTRKQFDDSIKQTKQTITRERSTAKTLSRGC